MVSLLLSILFAMLFVLPFSLRAGASSSGEFFHPHERNLGPQYASCQVWELGSAQTVEWTSAYPAYNVTLCQQNLVDSKRSERAREAVWTKYTTPGQHKEQWIVDVMDFDLDESEVFYFVLVPVGGNLTWTKRDGRNEAFASYWFNISRRSIANESSSVEISNSGPVSVSVTAPNQLSGSTTRLDPILNSSQGGASTPGPNLPVVTTPCPPTEGPSTPPKSELGTNQATSSPSTPFPQAAQSQEMQTGMKVAFGVGLGIGIPLILLVGILVGLLFWSQRAASAPSAVVEKLEVLETSDNMRPRSRDGPAIPPYHSPTELYAGRDSSIMI